LGHLLRCVTFLIFLFFYYTHFTKLTDGPSLFLLPDFGLNPSIPLSNSRVYFTELFISESHNDLYDYGTTEFRISASVIS